jgi:hypothetical protein
MAWRVAVITMTQLNSCFSCPAKCVVPCRKYEPEQAPVHVPRMASRALAPGGANFLPGPQLRWWVGG